MGSARQAENYQVAVSLSIANHNASLLVPYPLAVRVARRERQRTSAQAGAPEEVGFKTKPESRSSNCAGHVRQACRTAWRWMAGYGNNSEMRADIHGARLGLSYAAGSTGLFLECAHQPDFNG
jgi:hypothetical protein